MSEPIHILGTYRSQYDALSAMARELDDACSTLGLDSRVIDLIDDGFPDHGVYMLFNVPASLESLPPALFEENPKLRAVLFGVDHPFALPSAILDEWNRRNGLSNLRVLMPCLDDAHLLRYRFQRLVHRWVPHGVSRSSLVPIESITRERWDDRPFDVVVTGSVHSEAELRQHAAKLGNPSAIAMVREMVALMTADPHLGFVDACDLVLGSKGIVPGIWGTQFVLWRLAMMELNTRRRTALVDALQGLKVGVYGSASWAPRCTGTIEYAGDFPFRSAAQIHGNGRVAVAWNPTQFVHSYSERIMHAMAGGACVVTDDRILVRRDFNLPAETATLFNASDPSSLRARVEERLADPGGSIDQARRGRALVESRCLWEHRVPQIFDAAHTKVAQHA